MHVQRKNGTTVVEIGLGAEFSQTLISDFLSPDFGLDMTCLLTKDEIVLLSLTLIYRTLQTENHINLGKLVRQSSPRQTWGLKSILSKG